MTFYKVLSLLQLFHLYSLWKRQKFYHEKLCLEIMAQNGMFTPRVLRFEYAEPSM